MLLVALAPLAGRAAQDSEAAVRAAVEYANSPDIWGEALRRGDPAPLALAWEGDPLGYFSNEVLKYRARGLRLVSRLETLEWVAVHVSDDARAEVYTREWWRDFICTDQGEPRGWREASVADHYRLTLGSAGWRISGVDVTLLAGSFDWSPTEDMPDALAACRSVLPDAP